MIDAPREISTVRGPRGEEIEVIGRAGPLQLEPAPRVAAEAGSDLLVVKHGRVFVCSRRDGDIRPGFATGEGLYADDTRHLSELAIFIGGKSPVHLSSSAALGFKAIIDATNPELETTGGTVLPQMTLNLRRARVVWDRLHEIVEVVNHGLAPVETTLSLRVAADFADIFEIRGVSTRMARGHAAASKIDEGVIRFAYLGDDERWRQTFVELDPEPATLESREGAVIATWPIDLRPRARMEVHLSVEPAVGDARARRRSFARAHDHAEKAARQWREECTKVRGLHPSFNRVVDASMRDLRMLATPADGGEIIAAGIPWYVAPFGRDALITCYETMLLTTGPARAALSFLARHQARKDDALRDAEPGKILHELRSGELAGAGYVPHTPYYGTVDATPLFLMLAAAYYRWTADLDTMAQLKGSFDAALRWIDEFGDRDGDGFVEYERRSPAGLANQGWKDSEDAIVHPDGTLAEGPLALVEVQGYVYLAKRRIAEVYDALGEPDRAADLRAQASRLKADFNDAFWVESEGTLAFALDGAKRQVKTVTSNPAHCLYCDLVDPARAGSIVERLTAPDMFSGWGIRTMSSEAAGFNPISYHNGSVWPHDNAIAAAGFKRYGYSDATERVAAVMFEAALESPDARLPELFCGFDRAPDTPFVAYPVACRPQAWAAGVPFMIIQSMLGISARAPDGLLTVNQPELPEWLGEVELHDLAIGDSRIGLSFRRQGDVTAVALLAREGDIRVSIQE